MKKINKNRKRINFLVIVIGILFIISISNISAVASRSEFRYSPPGNSLSKLNSLGVGNNFDPGQCNAGQDFVIQVNPLGCTPSVVRSDFLEEGNYPVFCELSATKINPLIEVEAIESISFSGDYPPEVSGIGYHPAQAAINSRGNALINTPVLNNIGYVVLVLKKNKNESSMPDWIQGNLTANIRYDVNDAYGIGEANHYLPESTFNKWKEEYRNYGFWKGKGFVRASGISEDSATISIYGNKGQDYANLYDEEEIRSQEGRIEEISKMTLSEGETSRKVYLPGFYCLAGVRVRLDNLVNPKERVKINVDGNIKELGKGDRFLENKCWIEDFEKTGLEESVDIQCRTDTGVSPDIRLSITPRIEFGTPSDSEENDEKNKEIAIGEEVYENQYLVHLEKLPGSGKLVAFLLDGSKDNLEETGVKIVDGKVSDDDLARISMIRKIEKTKGGIEYTGIPDKLKDRIETVEEDKELTNDDDETIKFLGYKSPENKPIEEIAKKDKERELENYYKDGQEDYGTVYEDYASIKIEELEDINLNGNTFGEKALVEAIELADSLEQKKTMSELCERLENRYSQSSNQQTKEMFEKCGDIPKLSSITNSDYSVVVNGKMRGINFEGIKIPSFQEYGLTLSVTTSEGTNEVFLSEQNREEKIDNDEGYVKILQLDNQWVRLEVNYLSDTSEDGEEYRKETIRINKDDSERLGKYGFRVVGINLKKQAKITLLPSIDNKNTEADFSYKIGVEKRAIQLTPEKTKEKIENLNESIAEWEEKSESLGNVISGMKGACVATQGYLAVKSFISGFQGKGSARQEVMQSWYSYCQKNKEKGESLHECLARHNNEIEGEVETVSKVQDKYASEEVDDEFYNQLQDQMSKKEEIKNPDNEDESITIDENLQKAISKGGYSGSEGEGTIKVNLGKYDAKRLGEINDILESGNAGQSEDSLKKERYRILKDLETEVDNAKNLVEAQNKWADSKYSEGTTNALRTEATKDAWWDGSEKDGEKYQRIIYQGESYVVTLDSIGKNQYTVKEVYKMEEGKKTNVNLEEGIGQKIKNDYIFNKRDSESYKNKFSNPKVEYYETGELKGYPKVVPIDVQGGWYAATKPAGIDSLRTIDESGRPVNFYIGNVMDNGIEEFNLKSGDDEYRSFYSRTGLQDIGGAFPGLTEAETQRLVEKAETAILEAKRQYDSGITRVNILNENIEVGDPAISAPGMQCTDFMSPNDCSLLFNVCDPVLCPSSRCNMGGNNYVSNVVQSGIIGSIMQCLPNFGNPKEGGVAIPVCLTGVQAGIDGWTSIMKNHRDCLQHSVDTGEMVGVCDEIYSIYACEFMWEQALPLAKMGSNLLFGSLFGDKLSGGGEYIGMNNAWKGLEGSINYFTSQYASESYKAFNIRSTDQVGSEICKNFISARYPASGEFFDALLQPDSPSQFHGWFEEKTHNTATVPPTSQYKVFYHIYAGKDIGANYRVYLKNPEGTSLYQTKDRILIDSGFIPKDDYASETREVVDVSGYSQMCISVNAQEECGFKQVSTSAAVNYAKDKYLQSQSTGKITNEKECVSGSTSPLGFATSPNLQAGASASINPELRTRGITRVCSTENPGKGTDVEAGTEKSRWKLVGTCDDAGKVKCWLDSKSVENSMDFENVKNQTLTEAAESQNELLGSMKDWEREITGELEKAIKNIENPESEEEDRISELKSSIEIIEDALENGMMLNKVKAALIFYKARAESMLAKGYKKEHVEDSNEEKSKGRG